MLFSCQVLPSSLVQLTGLGADDQAEAKRGYGAGLGVGRSEPWFGVN
jgi:hypothetical protein